jgi:hypothetical protein
MQSSGMHARLGCRMASRMHRCHGMAVAVPLTAQVRPGMRSGPLLVRCKAGRPKGSGKSSKSSGQTAATADNEPSITAVRRMAKVRGLCVKTTTL